MARRPLLPVADALAAVLQPFSALGPEEIAIADARGRTLAADVTAQRFQPPFAASAMDGYAVRAADTAAAPVSLKVVAEIAAGALPGKAIAAGEAARIFTGAPMPEGADAVVIQENTDRDGDRVMVREAVAAGRFVRPAGLDFKAGDKLLAAGQRLEARHIALCAAANQATLKVRRRPRIGLLASGDELAPVGSNPEPGQIMSSNSLALAALIAAEGGVAVDLGIARDSVPDLQRAGAAALAANLDLLVTSGGASVGEHDLIQAAFGGLGLELDFWKVAMRPGKPLMFGKLRGLPLLGLPGNPVSSLIGGYLFLLPLIRRLLGRTPEQLPVTAARLSAPLRANDERQDYLRSHIAMDGGGLIVTPFPRQDSSMLTPLASADALIVRPPHAPAAEIGEPVQVILLP